MAGLEISSTLRNLKFMQRAAQKEEEKKEAEEVVSNGGFGSAAAAVSKKCVVIMEGDLHPGAVKGRMSFQHFNPSIDKLAEDSDNRSKEPGARTSSCHNRSSNREESANGSSDRSDSKSDHKRKQPVGESEEPRYTNRSPKNAHQTSVSPSSSRKGSHQKREKNDWSALRPPKSQAGKSDRHQERLLAPRNLPSFAATAYFGNYIFWNQTSGMAVSEPDL